MKQLFQAVDTLLEGTGQKLTAKVAKVRKGKNICEIRVGFIRPANTME